MTGEDSAPNRLPKPHDTGPASDSWWPQAKTPRVLSRLLLNDAVIKKGLLYHTISTSTSIYLYMYLH